MKIFFLWLCIISLGLPTAFAKQLELDAGGHFRFRAETRNDVGYMSPSHNNKMIRLRPHLIFKSSDLVKVYFEPQVAKTLGNPASGTTSDPDLSIHQAYTKSSFIDKIMTVKVGRQILNYGDQLFISPLEWNNTGRTWDAVKLTVAPMDVLKIDFVHADKSNNSTTNLAGDDAEVSIIYSM